MNPQKKNQSSQKHLYKLIHINNKNNQVKTNKKIQCKKAKVKAKAKIITQQLHNNVNTNYKYNLKKKKY